MIKFTIEGTPVAQGRARFSTKHGFAQAYDPEASKNYKAYVRMMAAQYAPNMPITNPVCLKLDFYRPIPKSFSKKKVLQAESGQLRPTSKPDGSNYLKLVEDSLNNLIWYDDSQIVDLHVSKWYSQRPRIEVMIMEIGEAGTE